MALTKEEAERVGNYIRTALKDVSQAINDTIAKYPEIRFGYLGEATALAPDGERLGYAMTHVGGEIELNFVEGTDGRIGRAVRAIDVQIRENIVP